jgi:membrane protease YdiL (CAAX protease family)
MPFATSTITNLFDGTKQSNMNPFDPALNPVVYLLLGLLIPLVYALIFRRGSLRAVAVLYATGIVMVALYPLNSQLGFFGGYAALKALLFIILPMAALYCIERWNVREILANAGIRRKNSGRSIVFGLSAAGVTVAITLLVATPIGFDAAWAVVMFLESMTEEFYFRGILLLYLARKTGMKVAYATSVISFIIIHPQNFSSLFIVSTAAQGILLAAIAQKTKNIIGPWVSHGLNRVLPRAILMALGA